MRTYTEECIHGREMSKGCGACDKEMMLDFVAHNMENIEVNEVAECIKEGAFTLRQLNDAIDVRIAVDNNALSC